MCLVVWRVEKEFKTFLADVAIVVIWRLVIVAVVLFFTVLTVALRIEKNELCYCLESRKELKMSLTVVPIDIIHYRI